VWEGEGEGVCVRQKEEKKEERRGKREEGRGKGAMCE
jgi:hypothetical protein